MQKPWTTLAKVCIVHLLGLSGKPNQESPNDSPEDKIIRLLARNPSWFEACLSEKNNNRVFK